MSTLALLHTTPVTLGAMQPLVDELAPGVRVINLLDDSLLSDVMKAGEVGEAVRERLRAYVGSAAAAGADAVLCCCSSVGAAVEALRPEVGLPFLRIDEPMAQEAVRLGRRIGVLGTVRTTLDPTADLIARAAGQQGREIELEAVLVEGAYDALKAGQAEEHDRLVLSALEALRERSDVVVLAQASMARLLPRLPESPLPVLTSPRSGLTRALEQL
ncbi:Asp/Glu racemase [Deinococcus irradiatisoli]|uniref:Asp/Glu racemase n=1 Tax=Deinococcus irradiatisoli TaxID=2202254 RepID=A0A2Z3JGB7_9DEIO|nr:aspartate/glutamate racemase family protein [Deinococcus irradiatisoli]AWN21959.1 Asp/Glu racemase [Deinococcus irradiatisoli]